MLTPAQITAGTLRLTAGKLTPTDVDGLVSVFKMFFGDLETKYSYDFSTKLTALDDTGNTLKQCAQIGACLNKMESLSFGVASLQGGSDALFYKQKDEYWQYVAIAFTKIYPLPIEFTTYDLKRGSRITRISNTLWTQRGEYI